jgi:hypothetical protein
MHTRIVAVNSRCDDTVEALLHREVLQGQMTDEEVRTTAIAAACDH